MNERLIHSILPKARMPSRPVAPPLSHGVGAVADRRAARPDAAPLPSGHRSSRLRPIALLLALVVHGCGGGDTPTPGDDMPGMDMPGMEQDTGEMDHSQHMGGAPSTREAIMLTAEQESALGVTYYRVTPMPLERTIRTVGRVEAPESGEATVTPKVDGFVESLLVSTTGESVQRGQALLTLYSPDLVAAQEQLLTARRLARNVDPAAEEAYASAESMLAAATRRLAFWDISQDQIDRLLETGEVRRTLTLSSPVNGVVLDKPVIEGQRVTPGTPLYRLADLSSVWIEGDVFEQDLQLVGEGTQAHIEVAAYPGQHFMGRVAFVYPTVDVQTRTNRVRVSLPNPGLRLKPGMFATLYFDVRLQEDVLAAPLEAIIATGERNLVFIHGDDGSLQPQEVVLGQRAGDFVQILSGLAEGVEIVGSANFLVDAESRLGGAMGSMPGMQHGEGGAAATADTGGVGMDHSNHGGGDR